MCPPGQTKDGGKNTQTKIGGRQNQGEIGGEVKHRVKENKKNGGEMKTPKEGLLKGNPQGGGNKLNALKTLPIKDPK